MNLILRLIIAVVVGVIVAYLASLLALTAPINGLLGFLAFLVVAFTPERFYIR